MHRAAALAALALVVGACAPAPTREPPEPAPPSAEASEAERPESQPAESGSESPETVRQAEGAPDPTPAERSEPQPSGERDSRDSESLDAVPAEPEPAGTSGSDPVEEQHHSRPQSPPQSQSQSQSQSPAPTQSASEEIQREARSPSSASPAVAESHELLGRITLVGGDAAAEEAVVYFVSEAAPELPSEADASETHEIVTRDKTLSPTVLAVPRGASVQFPNDDPILHNLFSVSPANSFDLGVYGPGESPSVTLDRTGVVNIYCNVHHDMHAHVLVVDTPWRTQPAADGSFRLEGLPTGPGELHIWHRQSERWTRSVELPATAPLRVSLEVSKPKLPPHRDKTGQSYNRRDRDPYR